MPSPQTPSAGINYGSKTIEECCAELQTNIETGLMKQQILERQNKIGYNVLDNEGEESLVEMFIEQFKNPMILLLLGAAGVSVLLGEYRDAISISLTILIVLTVAFYQEYQSTLSLDALKKLAPPKCHVVRNGASIHELASDLVPGDIIRFSRGDRIPADARAISLELDESNLTGETESVLKYAEPPPNQLNSYSGKSSIVFMSTLVRNGSGRGSAVVIGTGNQTELGLVLSLVSQIEKPPTPLQTKMDELGKQLSILSFAVIFVIGFGGLLQGRKWLEVFTIAVSLAVAAIPEGLPVVVAITLALGILRLSKRNAIVKKLPAVETLGAVDIICFDKTGTLTTNQMVLARLVGAIDGIELNTIKSDNIGDHLNRPDISKLIEVGIICNNSYWEDGILNGQPTEVAILDLTTKLGIFDLRKNHTRISEIPFDPEFKWMSVESQPIDNGTQPFYYCKGSVETILQKSSHVMNFTGEIFPISDYCELILEKENTVSSAGFRVLAFAYGECLDKLIFVGMMAMYDPPRFECKDTILEMVRNRIRPVMITGDSKGTAVAIASEIGIPSDMAISGQKMDTMSDSEIIESVYSSSIFYRTTPSQKLKIVQAFQSCECVVAMTGDGVNDTAALRLANIGIAMGNGTDVAKEAADMILVDDNVATLLDAIQEGKNIFLNIKNFLVFQLSTSCSALLIVAVATIFGYQTPLNAMQILWINIICDGPVAQSLGMEPKDPNLANIPPRNRNDQIISRLLSIRVLYSSSIVVLGTIFIYISEYTEPVSERCRTMVL